MQRNARTKLRSTQEPSSFLSCLACRSSLVPPRLEQRGKLKLSTCPLTRGHSR